ncbi:unnamed protein product [Musa hybrid cultivar]
MTLLRERERERENIVMHGVPVRYMLEEGERERERERDGVETKWERKRIALLAFVRCQEIFALFPAMESCSVFASTFLGGEFTLFR